MHDYHEAEQGLFTAQSPGSVQRNPSHVETGNEKKKDKLSSQGVPLSVHWRGNLQGQLRLVVLLLLKFTF